MRQLRRHPARIAQLTKSRLALDELIRIGVRIVGVTQPDVIRAADLSRVYGLLSGDALIVAIMQGQSLVNLASNDADFDRVPGIIRFRPV